MPKITVTIEGDEISEEELADILKDVSKVLNIDIKTEHYKPNEHGYCACPLDVCKPFSWGYGEECGTCGGRIS